MTKCKKNDNYDFKVKGRQIWNWKWPRKLKAMCLAIQCKVECSLFTTAYKERLVYQRWPPWMGSLGPIPWTPMCRWSLVPFVNATLDCPICLRISIPLHHIYVVSLIISTNCQKIKFKIVMFILLNWIRDSCVQLWLKNNKNNT